jgi:hypothetical protein
MSEPLPFLVFSGNDLTVDLLHRSLLAGGWRPRPRRVDSLSELSSVLNAERPSGGRRRGPVLAVCEPGREHEGLAALDAGADDYPVKGNLAGLARWSAAGRAAAPAPIRSPSSPPRGRCSRPTLAVSSSPGGGTTFELYFPVAEPAAPAPPFAGSGWGWGGGSASCSWTTRNT